MAHNKKRFSLRTPCTSKMLVDDERSRVTRFEFQPDQETGWHEHEYDYVITAITDCNMKIENPNGEDTSVFVKAGDAYRRNTGVKHNVINKGKLPMAFVEIELK
jgi:mannose-6-phosphate isomerase-like protein (cupin superfamily)